MNQNLGTSLAFLFLIGIGLFSLALGISNVRKRNRSRIAGWLRILLALILFSTAIWFFWQLPNGLFG